jgi:NitT/TauT family transport system ATP-binding protein
VIEVSGLEFDYGAAGTAASLIYGLDLRVARCTSYAIVGRTGCGKSTLLQLLSGLLRPRAGAVRIDGGQDAHREKTALVLQDGGLFAWKRLVDNVALGLLARGVPRRAALDRARDALASLGLAHRADAFPAQASGGERQRAALARSLVLEPDLLLADEMASSLDAVTRERVQDQLLEIAADRSLTMVVVTHNIDEAVALGSRIGVLLDGRIAAEFTNSAFSTVPDRYSPTFARMAREVREALDASHRSGAES